MESTGRTSGVPLPQDLRPKQREAIEAFLTAATLIIKLPVAYGKTETAAGSFAQLRHRAAANRLLYIVARRGQAKQAADSIPDSLARYGITTKALIVGENIAEAKRANAMGNLVVYIVTVQSLLSQKTWNTVCDMMQTGQWFVVVDEHHHYSNEEEAKWSGRIKNLGYGAFLAMSATPKRHDGSDYFGEPQVSETYLNAAESGYVKRLSLHAYQYEIDAVTVDGQLHKFTTEELAKAAGGEDAEAIEAFLSSRKMRFSPKYISPLVTFPVDRLIDLRCRNIRTQMLIRAMSCSHAKCVYEQIRSLLPEGFAVDWVGTGPNGRTDEDNDRILAAFCPEKDKLTGERPWTLDILITVGMAGEGLDTIDVTEISFLTPANNTISNLQTMGRGSRIIRRQPHLVCHINVDTGSELSDYVGSEIMRIFDNEIQVHDGGNEESEPREPNEYVELPDKLSWTIVDVRLADIRSEPMFKVIVDALEKDLQRRFDRLPTADEIDSAAEKAIYEYLNRSNNQTSILAQMDDTVTMAVRKIGGLVIRRMAELGISIERTLAGDLSKRINGRKKYELGAIQKDEETLRRHYDWLKHLERQILHEHGLNGVPQWLR